MVATAEERTCLYDSSTERQQSHANQLRSEAHRRTRKLTFYVKSSCLRLETKRKTDKKWKSKDAYLELTSAIASMHLSSAEPPKLEITNMILIDGEKIFQKKILNTENLYRIFEDFRKDIELMAGGKLTKAIQH